MTAAIRWCLDVGVSGAWDDWLGTLRRADARRAAQLRDRLKNAGCPDAEGWAMSEIAEDLPQAARYRFLHPVWPRMIDSWRQGIESVPAAQRLLATGVSRDELIQLARTVAYETAFAMLDHLDDDDPTDALRDLPSWVLIELDQNSKPTRRAVKGLYEDLLGLDPSGHEGNDLR